MAVAVAVAVLGAFRLRSGASMWRDEAWTWLVIHRPFAGVLGVVFTDEANMGPYYVALRVWSVFGASDVWLRAFSVVAGIGAAVALFRLVARYASGRAAALAAVLIVASPVFATHLTEARAYSWGMFLAVASTTALLRSLEGGGRRWTVLYGITTGLGVAVNLLLVLVVVAQLAAIVWSHGLARPPLRTFASGLAVAVATFAPFLPVTVASRDRTVSWIKPLAAGRIVPGLASAVGGRTLGVVMLLGLVALVLRLPPGRAGEVARMTVAIGVLPAVLLVLVSLVKPLFVPRYLTPSLPFLAAAAAMGFAGLPQHAARTSFVAVTTLAVWLFATGSPFEMTTPENLRAAAAFVERNAKPSDALVFYPTWARAGLLRYWRPPRGMDVSIEQWPDARLFPTERTTEELRRVLASHGRVWLIGYPGSTWHPRPEPLQPLLGSLLRRPRLASKTFAYLGGVRVTLLGSP